MLHTVQMVHIPTGDFRYGEQQECKCLVKTWK